MGLRVPACASLALDIVTLLRLLELLKDRKMLVQKETRRCKNIELSASHCQQP
jgi:hypothetical protein